MKNISIKDVLDLIQNNHSQLGSFGEFVYSEYLKSLGFQIDVARILQRDFEVHYDGKKIGIDVKTTKTHKTKFSGKRFSKEIIYDLVQVRNNLVKIFPDTNSPLSKDKEILIGNIDQLVSKWVLNKKDKSIQGPQNTHQINRRNLKNEILKIFPKIKTRVIFRGMVSQTRWKSRPDNLPGKESTIKRFELTIFVQMVTLDNSEEIKNIFVIPHSILSEIRMAMPDTRQKNKNITQVIDLELFSQDFPHLLLKDIQSLQRNRKVFEI